MIRLAIIFFLLISTPARADLIDVFFTRREQNDIYYFFTGQNLKGFKTRIVKNPPGCPPINFCGCGASWFLWGKTNKKDHWRARTWYKYPKTKPKKGAVAVRDHHVFVIIDTLPDGRVLAYDANSGQHKTRIRVRTLRGYSVRDPGASRLASINSNRSNT